MNTIRRRLCSITAIIAVAAATLACTTGSAFAESTSSGTRSIGSDCKAETWLAAPRGPMSAAGSVWCATRHAYTIVWVYLKQEGVVVQKNSTLFYNSFGLGFKVLSTPEEPRRICAYYQAVLKVAIDGIPGEPYITSGAPYFYC